MICKECGSDDIFVKTTGHPDTAGQKEAICGSCGHRAVVDSWDHTKGVTYTLDKEAPERTF